jgi:hypothetical protein
MGAWRELLFWLEGQKQGWGKKQPYSHPKKLNFFFFSGMGGWPQTDRVICRIIREIGESSSVNGVAVFCIRRTAA